MKFKTISSILEIKDFCKRSFSDITPFINFEFFLDLEQSNCTNKETGWIPEHIVVEQNNTIIALIPNYKKSNSNGEYVFDHIFANAHHQLGLNYFPKYLSAIPFTPVSREKFIYQDKEINKKELISNLLFFFEEKKISSFHINFINKVNSDLLNNLGLDQRLGIQYFWYNKSYKNFENFLSSLKRKKRKNIIKERAFLQKEKIQFVIKTGNQINIKDIKLFHQCYLNTIQKKWGVPYLNQEFFIQHLNSIQNKNVLLIQAYRQEVFLGCSIHFIGEDVLYGRYWGCLNEIPFLHFELCYYQAIEFAINNKIRKVEAGAQGEHKIARGYIPELTFSNHWFKNKDLKEPINDFLKIERKKTLDTLDYLKNYNPFND